MKIIKKLMAGLMWVLCRLLPVDRKKIVFSSYYGRGYGDNPKAIANELLSRKLPGLKLVWLTGEEGEDSVPNGIEYCPYDSLRKIYQLSTAAVWVDNCRKGARFKRKNQFYLQTWHGFALKRIESDVADKLPPEYEAYARRDSAQTDLIASDSSFMTEVYRRAFWYSGEIVETGEPRNDMLFCQEQCRERVENVLLLPYGTRTVLYAPTFRANASIEAYSLDYERLRQACSRRFGGDWSVVVRLHPNIAAMAGELQLDGGSYDATSYPDMQELLASADVVVSDYSSLMFDFALTGRPVFQFATDIEEYRQDRNFYFPLDELPFPLAESNDRLCEAIVSFDQQSYSEKWADFCRKNGMITDGKASQRCADIILKHLEV